MTLALTLKKDEGVILVDCDGGLIGTVRITSFTKNQVKISFDVPDNIEVARDTLTCNCSHHPHRHPVWWCKEQEHDG